MSWSASATVTHDTVGNFVVPGYDSLNEGAKAQADFMKGVLKNAFEEGHLEGTYNVSVFGHSADDSTRKTLGMSVSPITLEVEQAENEPAEES